MKHDLLVVIECRNKEHAEAVLERVSKRHGASIVRVAKRSEILKESASIGLQLLSVSFATFPAILAICLFIRLVTYLLW